MGKLSRYLTAKDRGFAARQRVFFLASAADAEVNLAPKGEDCLLFLDEETLLLLDYPGSTNRTGRDILAGGGVTLMFCSFDEDPRVLRIFCKGDVIGKDSQRFEETVRLFPDGNPSIVRQVFRLRVEAVENSCGLSVPVMRFEKMRESGVKHWAEKKAETSRADKA